MARPEPSRSHRITFGLPAMPERAPCSMGDNDIDERVQADGDEPQNGELKGDVSRAGVHELRDESQEEERRLRIQGLDQHAVAKSPSNPRRRRRNEPGSRRQGIAPGGEDRAHAEPEQVQRAEDFQRCEQLRTRQDQGGDADAARKHVNHAAQARTDARGDALGTAAGETSSGHVEDARPRRDGEQQGGGEEQSKLTEIGHGTSGTPRA